MSPTPGLDASLSGLVDTHLHAASSSFYSAAPSDASGFASGKDWAAGSPRGGRGGGQEGSSPGRGHSRSPSRSPRRHHHRVGSVDLTTDSGEDEDDVVMPLDTAGVRRRPSAMYVALRRRASMERRGGARLTLGMLRVGIYCTGGSREQAGGE